MRRWVWAVLVLALGTGCRSESGPAARTEPVPPTPTRAPQHAAAPQRLTTAILGEPKTFNPIASMDQASAAVCGNLFDTLVRINPRTAGVEPALAKSWERNAEGTQYTFFLRAHVRWHDGHPFSADDVLFTFRALQDERVPNGLRGLLAAGDELPQVHKVDDHTVRITLRRPFAPLLSALTAIPIVPQRILAGSLEAGDFAQQWGIDTPPERVVGTGPYRMTEVVPGEYIRYRRNPDYWMRDGNGRSLPYLEERTIRILHSQDAMYREFVAGKLDVYNVRPEEIDELRAREQELGIRVEEVGLSTGALFVTFNRNPRHYTRKGRTDPRLRWFTDKMFLRAIAHGIDRQRLVSECLNGFGVPAVSYMSPENTRFYHSGLVPYRYDPELARRLLKEGGYEDRDGDGVLEDPDGHRVEFTLNTNADNKVRTRMASILAREWAKLGLKVEDEPLDPTVLVDKLKHTFDWDAVLVGFTGVFEPHNSANLLRSSEELHLWNPGQESPATAWEAEIDRLVDEGAHEMDIDKRRRIYMRIQEILHEELPMIQTVREKRFVAFRSTLENFEPTPWGLYHPEQIHFSP